MGHLGLLGFGLGHGLHGDELADGPRAHPLQCQSLNGNGKALVGASRQQRTGKPTAVLYLSWEKKLVLALPKKIGGHGIAIWRWVGGFGEWASGGGGGDRCGGVGGGSLPLEEVEGPEARGGVESGAPEGRLLRHEGGGGRRDRSQRQIQSGGRSPGRPQRDEG